LAIAVFWCLGALLVSAQQPSNSEVVRGIDAAVQARLEAVAGYTVTEHYAVDRNNDEAHPVAEMTVKTTYRKDTGKSYTILSQSGSEIIRRLVLSAILDNEKHINQPGVREGAWLTSANYEMKLKIGTTLRVDGRDCYVLSLTPRRKSPHLIEGTIWVDSNDFSIVQVQGTASKSSTVFTGPTQLMRNYEKVAGFAQATRARATSNSFLFGQTIVTIDYRDYQVELIPTK
jgi:outer membrane lipoprotein-sorting protein